MPMRHLRFAVRMLLKNRVVTLAALLTFALGVSLNTAIFSVLQSIVLRQLPYPSADRLVTISRIDAAGRTQDNTNVWTLQQWRDRSRTIESFAMYGDGQFTFLDFFNGGTAEVWRGMRVSWQFFDTLGVKPFLGRTFAPDEDRGPHEPAFILTYALWATRFGSDPSIVGRTIQMESGLARVIGVLPSDFHAIHMSNPAETPQVFTQAGYDPTEASACHACSRSDRVLARLRPSVSAESAARELTAIDHDLARLYPADGLQAQSVRAQPLLEHLVGPVRRALWILFGAVSFVLLIACANVGGLQLTQAIARQREFAVRNAIGASRGSIVAQLLAENLLLAIVGGAVALMTAPFLVHLIVVLAPRELPRLDDVRVDSRVLAFSLATTLLTGFIFGMVPALSASRFDLNEVLGRTGGVSGRASGARLRGAVVVVAVALAFVLVLGTGLLGRSLMNLQTADSGFDSHDVLTLTLSGAYSSRDLRMAYLRTVVDRVAALPGVESAGTISNVPLSHVEPWPYQIDAEPRRDAGLAPTADVFWVSPGYFRTMRIPLKRGRLLDERDGEPSSDRGALISETLARIEFGGVDPVGHHIRIGPGSPVLSIVGVVGDVRYAGLDRPPGAAVYVPQGVIVYHYTRLVARTHGDPIRVQRAVLAAIRDIDPAQPVFHVQPMDDYVSSSLAQRRFAFALIALFGSVAMVLAVIGIYSLVAHSVAQRTPEIGLRVALGATPRDIMTMILRQGMTLTLVGLVIGVGIALVAAPVLERLLFGVTPSDPSTLAATAAILTTAALLACAGPAVLAARMEPLSALRAD